MTVSRPNPIPENYRRVTPAMVVQGTAKALDFYRLAAMFQQTGEE